MIGLITANKLGEITGVRYCSLKRAEKYSGFFIRTQEPSIAPDTHYVKDGEIKERSVMPVIVNGKTITNIPEDARLVVRSELIILARGIVSDGIAELEFPEPGTYDVRLELFPYRIWEQVFTA